MSFLTRTTTPRYQKVALVGAALGLASAIAAAPAFAASDVLGGVVVTSDSGSYQVRFGENPAGIGHTNAYKNGQSQSFTSTTHLNGQLSFYDGTTEWFAVCDRGTATDSADQGDTIVDCLPANPVNDYSALQVTTQYRIYAPDSNGVTLARMLYTVHNPTSADITVQALRTSAEWDFANASWNMNTNAGEKTEGADLSSSEVRWLNTFKYDTRGFLDSSVVSYGSAWRSADSLFFTEIEEEGIQFSGDPDGLESKLGVSSSQVTFKAGETSYFAFFSVYGYNPNSEVDVVSDTNAVMALFNAPFEGSILARGLPQGAKVLNWSSSAPNPGPNPEGDQLAKTGSSFQGFLALGALAGSVGLGALFIRRRWANR